MIRAVSIAFLVVLLVPVLGCESTVEPVTGTDEAFTLYGFFNPLADTQAVRVFPVEERLVRTQPTPIDAALASTDLTDGSAAVWRDSLVLYQSNLFPDTYGHVFYASFRAAYEHTYRLTATRSDGATSAVEVTVPPRVEPELLPFDVQTFAIRMPVRWAGAPMLNAVEVVYQLIIDDVEVNYVVPYGPEMWTRTADAIVVKVEFADDAQTIRRETRGGRFVLLAIEQRALVTNREWDPPGGVYDPEVLVQPGVFSNVEDGFGFVGAGYSAAITWLPEAEIVQQVGFELLPEE